MSSCLPRCFKEEDDRAYLLVKIKLLEEQVAAEIDEKLRLREQVQSLKVENDVVCSSLSPKLVLA